jgi:gluconolactonase
MVHRKVLCAVCWLACCTPRSPPESGRGGAANEGGSSTAEGGALVIDGGSAGEAGDSSAMSGTSADSGGQTSGAGNAATVAGGPVVSNGGSPSNGGSDNDGGSAGGSSSPRFQCPVGPFPRAAWSGTATRISGGPVDKFNPNGYGRLQGPVWLKGSLYFSEMILGAVPPARILQLTESGEVRVAIEDSGSSGLAIAPNGDLIAAAHKDGSLSRVALPNGPITPFVSQYMGSRFNSPIDLAILSDGTIFFSDPNFEGPGTAPQQAERLYRVDPNTRALTVVPGPTVGPPTTSYWRPTGVAISPDEQTLYVSGNCLVMFQLLGGGALGALTTFPSPGGGDGMAVDCAGNVYIAGRGPTDFTASAGLDCWGAPFVHQGSAGVLVYSPQGFKLGEIALSNTEAIATNVAFGNVDHETLYVTTEGQPDVRGVYAIDLGVPGLAY